MTRFAVLSAIILVFLCSSFAKGGSPQISEHEFDGAVTNLFYFDDSDVVIFTDGKTRLVYRSINAGGSWDVVNAIPKDTIDVVISHPFDKHSAVAVGKTKHWITGNRGESWRPFSTGMEISTLDRKQPIEFHATDSKKMIFHTTRCDAFGCGEYKAWYTNDGFKTPPRLLRGDSQFCIWAKSHTNFSAKDEKMESDGTVCVVAGRYSWSLQDRKLLVSNDYFNLNEVEPDLANGRAITGIVSIATTKAYIVAAAKSEGANDLAFYVTTDLDVWQQAQFGGHQIEENAYSLLESTDYSMQVDVLTTRSSNPVGALFTSNSEGSYFTMNIANTNRNQGGWVDFEKVSSIMGIVLVNVVDNWKAIEKDWTVKKQVKSVISVDDGRSFMPLRSSGETVHLHSITEMHNVGRLFSSPAPGLVMGIGNKGDFLQGFDDGDLYVSDDAGLNWRMAQHKPHLREFGDQGGILVAVAQGIDTDVVTWSINHGKDWNTAQLKHKIQAVTLTTVQDSTSLKFIITTEMQQDSEKYLVLGLDFGAVLDRVCTDSDFEDWYARVDSSGKPTCIMGQKQMFRRRKADSHCFVGKEFKDPVPRFEQCTCTDADYECDFNFTPTEDRKLCMPVKPLVAPKDQCKDPDSMFQGSSGYRLIPGNECIQKGGVNKDGPRQWPCSEAANAPQNGGIVPEVTHFKDNIVGHWYLEKKGSIDIEDETIILLTDRKKAYKSHDHGKSWEPMEGEISLVLTNQYSTDDAYFLTQSETVYYTKDRGQHVYKFEAPSLPSREVAQPLEFHPTERDWLIWLGAENCDASARICHKKAYYSINGGYNWHHLLSDAKKCEYMWRENRHVSKELVYCEQTQSEGPIETLRLLSSSSWFHEHDVLFGSIVEFAQRSEFVIVATKDQVDEPFLHCKTSLDGINFTAADFPPDFKEPHQTGYNALDSSTHAIFLHITLKGENHGSIVKSNSEGTSYVLSISDVNRNQAGFVDFEKILSLEGIALVNVVDNAKEVDEGAAKEIRTKITYNDGADWFPLSPPTVDADGKNYPCKHSLDHCSLHIHGFTERIDFRNIYYSSTAVGLIIGVGNVGQYLGRYEDGDTFISSNGGLDWKVAKKGTYKWAYGDQGSIIVLVEDRQPTNTVHYSLDEGGNWQTYQFSESEFMITKVTNLPSDTSRSFILWGEDVSHGSDAVTINIDFAGQVSRLCKMEHRFPGAEDDDYYRWEPKHPRYQHYSGDEPSDDETEKCFFGHVAQYLRRKKNRDCYNGKILINPRLDKFARNCSCTRQDFECDYNYKRSKDYSCHLVEGSKPDPLRYCRENPDAIEYFKSTGYRRIPSTTCQGGKQLDSSIRVYPCPGKEDEFRKKSAVSPSRVFFALTIPFALAGGIGYYVWRNWDGKFGRIRLGDTSSFDDDSPWIRWPVMLLSGLVAIIVSAPLLVSSFWRSITSIFVSYTNGAYTSRSSFSRNTGAYSVVDNDDGDLLGEDSEGEG